MRELFALLERRNAEQTTLDRRTAVIAWSIHRCNSKRKDGDEWRVNDFMPGEAAEPREQTPEEMLAIFQRMKADSGH